MAVDWITVAAQIVNFLILVWLLKRFLYGPIIRAMDERHARIAQQLRDAQHEKETAAAEAERYRQMQDALETQREAQLAKAREEADGIRRTLQSAAREDVAAQRAEWLGNMADEREAFLDDIKERSAEAFSEMARRALGDLANETLEDQIVRRFLVVLREFDERDRKKMKAAWKRARRPVAVRTAFDVAAECREEINATLRDMLGEDVKTEFERSADLMCGIEIKIGGQMARWGLDSFMDDIEIELRQAVEARLPDAGRGEE